MVARQRVRRQVGIGGAIADRDGTLSKCERGVHIAHRPGGLTPGQCQVSVHVALAARTDDPFSPAFPRRRERILAGVAVGPGDIDGEVRGP